MKTNHRRQLLNWWVKALQGKKELDPKAVFPFLEKKLKGAYSPPTLKRYNATLLGNLYENGYLEGKKGKTFFGDPLPIVKEITLPVLDKCLTTNFRKVQFKEADLQAPAAGPPAPKKTKKPARPRKPPQAKSPAPQVPEKKKSPAKAKPEKPAAPKKKVPAKRLVGRKSDLLRMGQGSFLYAQQLNQQIEEMERQLTGYQRIFDSLQKLFSREMDEVEEWLLKLLK